MTGSNRVEAATTDPGIQSIYWVSGTARHRPFPTFIRSRLSLHTSCAPHQTPTRSVHVLPISLPSPRPPPSSSLWSPRSGSAPACTIHQGVPSASFVSPAMGSGLVQNIMSTLVVLVAHAPPSWRSKEMAR